MYIPNHFNESDRKIINEIIDQNGFAVLISPHHSVEEKEPYITHIPLYREGDILWGHVARANKHWQRFEDGQHHTVVFQGVHGYISPRWYEKPDMTVPTWAYATVHITGPIQILEDEEGLHQFLKNLSVQYEGKDGWSVEQVKPERYDALKRGIVCFKMDMAQIECKLKMDQNKSAQDRRNVIQVLGQSNSEADRDLSREIKKITKA